MGGSSNSASREAEAAEKARQAAIAQTQGRVNAVFDSPARQAEIEDMMAALRGRSMEDLDREKSDVDRQLKFALARGGLTGGSVNVDKQREKGDAYTRALLNLERGVQGAGADLQAADQDARARLIQLATSGLDATTGASQAAAAMRTNLQSASSTNLSNMLGDSFAKMRGFFEEAKDRDARRRADYMMGGWYAPMGYGGG
jgi:hypothetical protein